MPQPRTYRNPKDGAKSGRYVTIYLSRKLADDLDSFGKRINVSKVCQAAIREALKDAKLGFFMRGPNWPTVN